MPMEELRQVIPPGSFISINCDKYNHNGKSCNAQIVIFFVAAERDANSADLATWGLVCLHNKLKAKGQIYLTCAEGGKVMEVTDNAGIEKIKMTINQNTKMKGRVPFSSGLDGLLLRMFFWQFLLGTFPAF